MLYDLLDQFDCYICMPAYDSYVHVFVFICDGLRRTCFVLKANIPKADQIDYKPKRVW